MMNKGNNRKRDVLIFAGSFLIVGILMLGVIIRTDIKE